MIVGLTAVLGGLFINGKLFPPVIDDRNAASTRWSKYTCTNIRRNNSSNPYQHPGTASALLDAP